MPVMVLDGLQRKMSCGPCIRGHRSSKCNHLNRLLVEVRQPGRPLARCPHKIHPCSCDRLVVVNYAVPYAKSCPCKARSLLSHQKTGAITAAAPSAIHTADCLHNPANVDILSDLIVVNNVDPDDPTALASQAAAPRSCCGPSSQSEPTTAAAPVTPACCSSEKRAPVSLLEALQTSDSAESKLVAYYIHGDGKQCSRVQAHKTPLGHLTTRQAGSAPTGTSPVTSSSGSSGSQSRADVGIVTPFGQAGPIRPAVQSTVGAFSSSQPVESFPVGSFPLTAKTDPVSTTGWASSVGPGSHDPTMFSPQGKLCMCGEQCSCVGCPEHLNNDATMEYVLFHVAAADLATPPQNPGPNPVDGNTAIPQEWTMYENAFDFMAYDLSLSHLTGQTGIQPGPGWLQPTFDSPISSSVSISGPSGQPVTSGRTIPRTASLPIQPPTTTPEFGYTNPFPSSSVSSPPTAKHTNWQTIPTSDQRPPTSQYLNHLPTGLDPVFTDPFQRPTGLTESFQSSGRFALHPTLSSSPQVQTYQTNHSHQPPSDLTFSPSSSIRRTRDTHSHSQDNHVPPGSGV